MRAHKFLELLKWVSNKDLIAQITNGTWIEDLDIYVNEICYLVLQISKRLLTALKRNKNSGFFIPNNRTEVSTTWNSTTRIYFGKLHRDKKICCHFNEKVSHCHESGLNSVPYEVEFLYTINHQQQQITICLLVTMGELWYGFSV